MTGYLHPGYAGSFAEFGTPRELPLSGGWILERPIPGTSRSDAIGCYPLFACRDWTALRRDLEALSGELVSVALVADPFGDYDVHDLAEAFDQVKPFKEHLVTDLSRPIEETVSAHHRYWARKALRELSVEVSCDPASYLDEWVGLYSNLTQRHDIHGIRAFSRQAFERQLPLPGMTMFRATREGQSAGIALVMSHGEVAYGHLAAMSEIGYRTRAAYALVWSVIEHFAGKLRWLDSGAAPGTSNSGSNGLLAFKRGWSTGTRTAHFCAKILDEAAYWRIARSEGLAQSQFFPAYRDGEFD